MYVTNGKQIVAYDLIKETFQMMKLVGEPVAGFIHEENQLLKFELIVKLEDKNPLKFFMVWSTLIVVYSFKGDDFNVFTTISAPK